MASAQKCPSCQDDLDIERLRCPKCQTLVEGHFRWPRLSRLGEADQQLVELMILASGSLKTVAKRLGISYPTVRKRLDELIERLTAEIKADEAFRRQLLHDVQAGKRSASEAKQLLRGEGGTKP